ncbi:Carboxypeptidase regulatory-like domain protein [anaerobic digester metagenome]
MRLLIVDKNDKPVSEHVMIQSQKTKKGYHATSDKNGIAEILLPVSDTYAIHFDGWRDYDKIEIPATEYLTYEYKIYFDRTMIAASDSALVHFQVIKSNKKPLSETVILTSVSNGQKYNLTTNKDGKEDITLPNNDSYLVSYTSAPDYDIVEIPNIQNYELFFTSTYDGSYPGAVYPSRSKALFAFRFIDLDSVPVAGEKFYLTSIPDSTTYSVTTNAKGQAYLLVPIGYKYSVSSEYFKNFGSETISSTPGLYHVNVTLKYISSAEYRRRQEEEARLIRERELEWEKFQEKLKELEKRRVEDSVALAKSIADGTYTYPTASYAIDTTYYSVMNRNSHWKNKLIILDVTGSMYPYTEQVKTWYKLNYAQGDPMQFVFFNDGNNLPDSRKVIGSTGGIHYCKFCDLKTFEENIATARKMGNGGDGPENDIEAILAAINNCSNYTDIILVADNLAPVKDIELLSKVNKPIKVILCGSAQYDFVNTDYINIAFATKGSIHTIEEDILNIGETIEGGSIKIGKYTYILTHGMFIRY